MATTPFPHTNAPGASQRHTQRTLSEKTVVCNDIDDKSLHESPVMAVVADREFVHDGTQHPPIVSNGRPFDRVTWTLNMTCLVPMKRARLSWIAAVLASLGAISCLPPKQLCEL